MEIHHIGYAVKDIEKSLIKFEELGYCKETEVIRDESRKVYIQFLNKGGYRIELISSMEANSPIDKIVKRGAAPYHVCYETENLEEKIDELIKTGYILVEKPSKAVAINNRRVAFVFSKDTGLLELLEKVSVVG